MSFEQNQENRFGRNRAESRDNGAESKEKSKDDALEQAMGARERAEVVSTEVQTTQKQMQNITMNMQQVVKAVAALRAQLALSDAGAIPSVRHDQKVLEKLQKKMSDLKGQLGDLKRALVSEEQKKLMMQNSSLNPEEALEKAEATTATLLEQMVKNKK
jgi:chromosome segregation ATPase